jgi:serine/threonine-protein kinase RsbW
MYSEATAAHPYSQKANIDLGAHETGFLLGWIPATVENDAAAGGGMRRNSAALFHTKLNDGHDRRVYAPERHHEIVGQTLALCELRGTLAQPPAGSILPERTEMHTEVDADHNLALLTVTVPGADLEGVLSEERRRLFDDIDLDAIYIDLPLEVPATALVADHLERLGVSYSGIFPNPRADGDVLRMQSLHRVRVKADDVAVASDHGRELLEYVLADLERTD